jgi:thioredoxin-related protein
MFLKARVGALIALLGVLAALTASCVTTSGGETGGLGHVDWLYDWQEARSVAQAENKPIMVNFYTDVCPQCARLDQNAFTNEALTDFLNENFVNVKINPSKPGMRNVGEFYGVRFVPTNLFTGPNGREFGRTVGYRDADKYRSEAVAMLNRWKKWLESSE